MDMERELGQADPDDAPAPGEHPDTRPLPPRTPEGAGLTAGVSLHRNTMWASAGNIGIQGIQLLTMLVLAHLLTPRDFGLVAIVLAVAQFAQLLTDLGLSSAIIQLPRLEPGPLTAAFWLNALSGLVLSAVAWGAAPWMASLYRQPELAPLLRVASLTFLLSLGAVPIGILERASRFKEIALIEMSCFAAGALSAFLLALGTTSAYPLVVGPVVTSATLSCALWVRVPFNPFRRLQRGDLRSIIGSSSGITGFNVINYWSRNVDNMAIGKVSGPVQVGYYSRAYTLMMAPVVQVINGASRALLPHLAEARRNRAELGPNFLQATRYAALSVFPVAVIMAAGSHDVVAVVLGHQWMPAAPMLTLLALSIPGQVLTGPIGAVFQSVSRNRALLAQGTLSAVCTVAAIFAGLPWGPTGVCTALLIRTYVLVPLLLHIPLRIVGVSWKQLVAGVRGPASAGALMYGVLWLTTRLPLGPYARLPVDLACGGATYLLAVAAFDRSLAMAIVQASRSSRRRRSPSGS